ncbi:MAG TPA: helix-turn-helix domain-containing protein [Mycobacteriales bacterium]|nr:helix-turn-helix domain-containing protein [Mycobacteriales bacterium]
MVRTGRPRAFDTDQALSRARDLFWSKGYGATSVQDLVDQLKLQRGSLYAAFGDKRALYLRAVALYARENHERLERLLSVDPILPTIRQLLLEPGMLTGAPELSSGGRRGCLLGNTAAELLPDDEAAAELVANAYRATVQTFTTALRRSQHNGEVTSDTTPEAQAQLLLLLFQGAALVGRAGEGPAQLAAGVDAALDALRAR